jgi:ligand-binding sensor domain-containing protein
MRRLFPSLLLALSVASAAAHNYTLHPNPSIVVMSIAEGPDGFLWLAATDGLYRFDGFHYHKIGGYPFSTARFLGFTRDGSLWCGDYEGLARFRNGRFEVVHRGELAGMATYPDHVFATLQRSLSVIGLDGSVRRLPHWTRRDLLFDPSGRLWAVCMNPVQACSFDPRKPEKADLRAIPTDFPVQGVLPDSRGRLWLADDEHAVLVENGRPGEILERLRTREHSRPGPLLPGRDGQLWFLGETVRGLNSSVAFHDRADHSRYPPVSGYEDDRRHLWVAAAGLGLVEWSRQPDWQRWFPEDIGNAAAAQIIRDAAGAAAVATDKGIFRLDTHGETWSRLAAPADRYYNIAPLDDGGFLVSIKDQGVARLSVGGRIVERVRSPSPATEFQRKILRDPQGRIWVGSKRALFRLEGQPGSLQLREEPLPGIRPGEYAHAVDLELDAAGRLWAGYAEGLAWLDDDGRWQQIVTDQPVRAVRSFAVAGDDIWVAHRTSGAFSRLHRSPAGWRVTSFNISSGYGPIDTDFLQTDSRGWIWRGTSDGVMVSDGVHVAPEDWLHIHPGNGLAARETGQYGFFEDRDHSVWIAGDEGITHIRPDPAWFAAPREAPPPRVTRVDADRHELLSPAADAALSSAQVVRIEIGSLQAPRFRDFPLRYRLLPLQPDWKLSRDGILEFRGLPPDSYRLETGYAGAGPSRVGGWPFRVGGPSLLSWRGWLVLLMAAGALVSIVRYAPWLDRTRFRLAKAAFLLRRCYDRRRRSSSGEPLLAEDYSGQTLAGRYKLERAVSRGGFSVVYRARDLRLAGSAVAVKVLNTGMGQGDWVRDRFAHEVAALRSVEHPGVVRVLDSWVNPAGEPCLAMPLLEGPTLRAALREGPISPPRAARLIRQIGAALVEVHRHGMIHRDLKPENLMLLAPGTDREQAVIIDFGTAGLRTAENELVATTLMAGSFHYLAPERLTGRFSAASDVFSLSVIILEMLARKRLSDLHAMFSEPGFRRELERALRLNLQPDAAAQLAGKLAPGFDPEPRRRPAAVDEWAAELAAVLVTEEGLAADEHG